MISIRSLVESIFGFSLSNNWDYQVKPALFMV